MRLLVVSLFIFFTWSVANCHVIFLGFSYCLWTNKDVFFRVSIHVTYRKMIICSVFLQSSMNLSVPQVQDTSPNHLPLLLAMQDIQGLFLLSSLLCSWQLHRLTSGRLSSKWDLFSLELPESAYIIIITSVL